MVGFPAPGSALVLHAKPTPGLSFGTSGDFFDATDFHSLVAPSPPNYTRPSASTLATPNMDGEKYSASLIRLWRVWRTTKEMMNDRVGCACAEEDHGPRADCTKGIHDCRR